MWSVNGCSKCETYFKVINDVAQRIRKITDDYEANNDEQDTTHVTIDAFIKVMRGRGIKG